MRSRYVTLERIRGAVDDALGRVFGLFDALAVVAVVVAALGIVNTLTMNVVERVREIGILRAAGMTRRQVWRSVVVEAGILGLAGGDRRGRAWSRGRCGDGHAAGGRPDVGTPSPVAGRRADAGARRRVAMLAAAYPARLAAALSIVRAVQFE